MTSNSKRNRQKTQRAERKKNQFYKKGRKCRLVFKPVLNKISEVQFRNSFKRKYASKVYQPFIIKRRGEKSNPKEIINN